MRFMSGFWGISKKVIIADENELISDFEKENHILLDSEKQVKKEDREEEMER